MAVTFTNIAVGQGVLSVGPSTQSPTADDTTAVDVGATQNGITVAWEPNMVDIEIDQYGDAARVIQSRIKVMVTTNLVENTLVNLATAWGYATNVAATAPGLTTGGGTFNFGTHGVYPEEHYIKIVATAPGSTATTQVNRTYKCDRAIQYITSSADHKRDAPSSLEISFRILPLASQTGKEYGTIIDA